MPQGLIKVVCGLDNEGQVIPPSADSRRIDEEVLCKKLKQSSMLPRGGSRRKAIRPGCSVVLTLLTDHLFDCYDRLMNDKKVQKYLDQLIYTYDSRNNRIKNTMRRLVDAYLGMVLAGFGKGSLVGRRGTAWHFVIGATGVLTPLKFQEHMVKDRKIIESHARAMDIGGFESGKRFLDAVDLFYDTALQKTLCLFEPQESTPDLSRHIGRLLRRVRRMNTYTQDFNRYRMMNDKFHKHEKYGPNLESGLKMLERFFDETEKALQDCQTNAGSDSLSQLYRILRKWIGEFEDIEGAFRIIYTLLGNSFDVLSKNYAFLTIEQKSEIMVVQRVSHLMWMKQTIMDEAMLCVLNHLKAKSNMQPIEINEGLSALLKVVHTMQTSSVEEVKKFLNDAEHDESRFAECVRDIWQKDFLLMCREHLKPLLRLLECRIERVSKPGSSDLEASLAMRDTLIVLGGELRRLLDITSGILKRQEGLALKRQLDDPSRLAWNTMNELLELQKAALDAAVGRIEVMVGRCIEEMQQSKVSSKEAQRKNKKSQREKMDNEIEAILRDLGEPDSGSTSSKRKKKRKKRKGAKTAATVQHAQKTCAPAKPPRKMPPKTPSETPRVVAPLVPVVTKVPEPRTTLKNLQGALGKVQRLSIEGPDSEFRGYWRSAQIANALHLLRQVKELLECKPKHVLATFDYVDVSRRLLEIVLETVLATYPVTKKGNSCLKDIKAVGHRLHLLIRRVLSANEEIPESVRNEVFELRWIPFAISESNACVNYLHTTDAKRESLHHRTQKLLDFLMTAKLVSLDPKNNRKQAEAIARKRHRLLAESLYFTERIFAVMVDPNFAEKRVVPTAGQLSLILDQELPSPGSSPRESQNSENADEVSSERDELEEALSVITNPEQALSAIKTAEDWITVHLAGPVEGGVERVKRTRNRNEALKNVLLYLLRLKRHLDGKRFKRPNLTIFGQLGLLRRMHKESLIAALYHSQNGTSTADEMRYANNPLSLMKELRRILKGRELPFLRRWLASVHHVVSYPVATRKIESMLPAEETLRELVKSVKELSERADACSDGWTLVGGGSVSDCVERSIETDCRKRILENEHTRTYPCLYKLLQILRIGLPNPRSIFSKP